MACELHCNGRAKAARSGVIARKWLICLGLWVPGVSTGWPWLQWATATVLTLCQHSGGGGLGFRFTRRSNAIALHDPISLPHDIYWPKSTSWMRRRISSIKRISVP